MVTHKETCIVDMETRTCRYCGKEKFRVMKGSKNWFCSNVHRIKFEEENYGEAKKVELIKGNYEW